MRHILLIMAFAASISSAYAQDNEADFEYAVAELPVIQLCAVEENTQVPVPFASISVEYVDTIVNASTDAMGLLDFTPRSFPFTLTASGEGMIKVTYGIMEQPEGPLTILMTRESAKEETLTERVASRCPENTEICL